MGLARPPVPKKESESTALVDPRPPTEEVKQAAARLYGQGYKRPQIAKILLAHLITDEMKTRPPDQQSRAARGVLVRWERTPSFRDLIWGQALVKLDLETPAMMAGVMKKAKRGRVDAAKLILAVTGRHSDKQEVGPTAVTVVFSGVPRPPGRKMSEEFVEGEAVELE